MQLYFQSDYSTLARTYKQILNISNDGTHADCHFVCEIAINSENQIIKIDDGQRTGPIRVTKTSEHDSAIIFMADSSECRLKISKDSNMAAICNSNQINLINNAAINESDFIEAPNKNENEIRDHEMEWNLQKQLHIKLNDTTIYQKPIPDLLLELMQQNKNISSFELLYDRLIMANDEKYSLDRMPATYQQFKSECIDLLESLTDTDDYRRLCQCLTDDTNNDPVPIALKLALIAKTILNESYSEAVAAGKYIPGILSIEDYLLNTVCQAFHFLSNKNNIPRPQNEKYSKNEYIYVKCDDINPPIAGNTEIACFPRI